MKGINEHIPIQDKAISGDGVFFADHLLGTLLLKYFQRKTVWLFFLIEQFLLEHFFQIYPDHFEWSLFFGRIDQLHKRLVLKLLKDQFKIQEISILVLVGIIFYMTVKLLTHVIQHGVLVVDGPTEKFLNDFDAEKILHEMILDSPLDRLELKSADNLTKCFCLDNLFVNIFDLGNKPANSDLLLDG